MTVTSSVASLEAEHTDAEVIRQVLREHGDVRAVDAPLQRTRVPGGAGHRPRRAGGRRRHAAGVRERLHAPAPIQRLGAVFDVVDEDCDQRIPGARPPPGQVRGLRRRTLECGAIHVPQSFREPRAAGIHRANCAICWNGRSTRCRTACARYSFSGKSKASARRKWRSASASPRMSSRPACRAAGRR